LYAATRLQRIAGFTGLLRIGCYETIRR